MGGMAGAMGGMGGMAAAGMGPRPANAASMMQGRGGADDTAKQWKLFVGQVGGGWVRGEGVKGGNRGRAGAAFELSVWGGQGVDRGVL